ncbi:hypothetical protein Naga_100192g7 [Nannochloropsis gaditana]|uniref:Uncharacterized protein n=1 Tax=Nannochloropsis gaditana TaxID=72520 RepID=W7U3N8_9STRA|nr:hypothetical protein Naga_100192g7 [Nannochloropsis gaditana]
MLPKPDLFRCTGSCTGSLLSIDGLLKLEKLFFTRHTARTTFALPTRKKVTKSLIENKLPLPRPGSRPLSSEEEKLTGITMLFSETRSLDPFGTCAYPHRPCRARLMTYRTPAFLSFIPSPRQAIQGVKSSRFLFKRGDKANPCSQEPQVLSDDCSFLTNHDGLMKRKNFLLFRREEP